ncbi:MAG: AMP nucleosidase [Alphaproteobacteria bacterium]|nr:AMP nucleosidase [Alphaproteobacteria bacterium]
MDAPAGSTAATIDQPPPVADKHYDDAGAVVAALDRVYRQHITFLQERFAEFEAGTLGHRVRAVYPRARFRVGDENPAGPTASYGYADKPGLYEGTFTRLDLFRSHLTKQFRELLSNHGGTIEVGLSDIPIPLPFAFPDGMSVGDGFDAAAMTRLRRHFDMPALALMDDRIVNGEVEAEPGGIMPLALFTAPRVDYSLHRLRHYCGSGPEHFQNFVLFTNYQVYVDGFIQRAEELVRDPDSGYTAFVEPGERMLRSDGTAIGVPSARAPQMPAYHLMREGHQGITMINIGIGPSNAKTISDHVAVLRPHAWIMLGHCAGLRNTQRLGDYVLAHAYQRDDHVLDADLPVWVPIPALAEVQQALEGAVADVTGLDEVGVKRIMRTGTVASTDNRNWELREQREPDRKLSQSRAIALDMESATVAANGFRFRVPYGTLLCVSDKPLHGELKLPGMADDFYRRQVAQHLDIGFRTMERLRALPPEKLHSRKLRSFNEVPLQ